MIVPPVFNPVKVLSEKDIERKLLNSINKLGGRCYKFKSENNRGVSDRIVIYNGHVYFVEVKTIKGVISKHQLRFRDEVLINGGEHHFIIGIEGLKVFIDYITQIAKP